MNKPDVTKELASGNVSAPASGSAYARELYKSTSKDRRYVKRLRKLGASNYEIANALGIPEDAPVLHE